MSFFANEDLRIEILKARLTYRQIAKQMNITPVWLSKVMSRELTPEMKKRISVAVDELTIAKRGRV